MLPWTGKYPAAGQRSIDPAVPNDPILKGSVAANRHGHHQRRTRGTGRQLERLEALQAGGLRLPDTRQGLAASHSACGSPKPSPGWRSSHSALVLINDDTDIARRVGADGCTCRRPAWRNAAPTSFSWVGASCHNAQDKSARAGELGLDYALLARSQASRPPTRKPAALAGPNSRPATRDGNTLPVFALSGVKLDYTG